MEQLTWHIEKRRVEDLKVYEHNPRVITEKGFSDLKNSIDKFGLAEPLVIQPNGLIIGGHARYQVLKAKGEKEADCYVPNRELTEQELKELNIRLNKNIAGEFNWDILANEFDIDSLKDWGFNDFEIFGKSNSLAEDIPDVDLSGEKEPEEDYIIITFENNIQADEIRTKLDISKTVRSVSYNEFLQKINEN